MIETTVETHPRYDALRPWMEQIASEGIPSQAQVVYRSRNIIAVDHTPLGDINIKSFRLPNPLNALIYTRARMSKARRSYEYAKRLMEAGIGTPEPVGYIELKRSGLLRQSYYLSRQIEASEFRLVERRADERELLEALGREMVRLHDAGILMLDFSPGNILFTHSDEEGYRFYYVDLNRTRFDVDSHPHLMEMFRAIVVEPRQVEIIAAAYAREKNIDVEATVADALSRHARFQRRLANKRRIKSILMPWKKKYRS